MSDTLSIMYPDEIERGMVFAGRLIYDKFLRPDGAWQLEMASRGAPVILTPNDPLIRLERDEYTHVIRVREGVNNPTPEAVVAFQEYEERRDNGMKSRSRFVKDPWDMSNEEIMQHKARGLERMKRSAGEE